MFSNIVCKFRPICCSTSGCKSSHIACLVKGRKRVISVSTNDYRRQYVNRSLTTNVHAEIMCLKDNKDLRSNNKIKKNLSLLILRYRKDGSLCDSKPCSDCKEFLIHKGLSFVYCSVADGSIQKLFLKNLPNYLSPSQILFQIFGTRPLKKIHVNVLEEMGLTINSLHKMPQQEQLAILKKCYRNKSVNQ